METHMDESQSLEVIREMINRGKKNLKEGSQFYLIWGWAVLLSAIIQYVLINVVEYENHWISWPILMVVASIVSIVEGRRLGKKQRFVSFTDSAMIYLWGGFFMYILVVLAMSSQIGWTSSYVLVIGLYGLGTFVSGGLLRFRPLILGGLLSIALAAITIFIPTLTEQFSNVLILLSISIICSYLIPGYILRMQFSRDAA